MGPGRLLRSNAVSKYVKSEKRQRLNVKSVNPRDIRVALEDRSRADVTIDETFFAPGDRVFHQKFGMGTVKSADGDKLEIAFDKAGEKKLFQGL